MGEMFEEKVLELNRRGEQKKAEYLKNLDNVILSSFIQRIQKDDKTVLKEIVVPDWVSWNLLRDWALSKEKPTGRKCALCTNFNETGVDFKNKFVCRECFFALKNME